MLPRAPRFKNAWRASALLQRRGALTAWTPERQTAASLQCLRPKSGSQWTCSTTRDCRSVRFPTGGGALVRIDFQESGCPGWIAAPAAAQMALRVLQEGASAPRVRAINLPGKSRALSLFELQGNYDPPTGVAPVSRRYQRRASLPTLWRNLKWSGISVLPRVFAAPAATQMALRVS